MALTGMQIYKSLPKTNCKDCGFPTCMAFAMQVAAKQKALTDCKHISADAQATLADASSPPMKLVKLGAAGKEFIMGQETVMFRHEEKFRYGTGIAYKVPASVSDADLPAEIEKVNKAAFDRVGQRLKVACCAINVDGAADAGARAKLAASKSLVPLILMGKNADKMRAAVEAIKGDRPLIYQADAANIDAFADIAGAAKVALAVAADDLVQAADLTQKAKAKGVEDMLLSYGTENPGDTLRSMTIARRAALKKTFRVLGFPAMVDVQAGAGDAGALLAASFACKYAAIVMIDSLDPAVLLPIMTAVQNVYTDPQVPNMVQAKLYEVGRPDENSPVLFTTNFSLTYFSVEGEVERSKIPAWICVVETEGLGVLNAYAGDKISVEKVLKTLADQKVAEKVKHRKLIIPGLLPIFRAEIEESSEWKEVIIGPEQASKIPAFLNQIWK